MTDLPQSLFDDGEKQRWIELMDFEPRQVFNAVRAPIPAFYGELDSLTPLEPSVAAWPPHATVVVVPEVGHGLHGSDGTLSPLYERTLIEWLS